MLFFLPPNCLQWFGLYKKLSAMVDYQTSLEAWLQNASFFQNEPLDYTHNFDLLSNEKTNSDVTQDLLGLKDLDWLDENVDLSVLENPKGSLGQFNETERLMDDDIATFWGFLDSDFNPSYVSSENFKEDGVIIAQDLDVSDLALESALSEVSDSHLASPQCNSLQMNSPSFIQSPSSCNAFSDISEVDEPSEKVLEGKVSVTPETEIITNIKVGPDQLYASSVNVNDGSNSPVCHIEGVFSVQEVVESVKKRKLSGKRDVPKVKICLLKEPFHPYVRRTPKVKDRRERKKVQNKEAAARYRIKKRMEEKGMLDEVTGLEQEQKKLKKKHDELDSEIKYLKSLMCEMLKKRGIIK